MNYSEVVTEFLTRLTLTPEWPEVMAAWKKSREELVETEATIPFGKLLGGDMRIVVRFKADASPS